MKNIIDWGRCINENNWYGGMCIHNEKPNLEDYIYWFEACLEGWKGSVDIHFIS